MPDKQFVGECGLDWVHRNGISLDIECSRLDDEMAALLEESDVGVHCKGPTELQHYLFLGSHVDADSLGLLQQLGITHVLNCAGDGASLQSSGIINFAACGVAGYKEISAEDTEDYDIRQHFDDAFSFINEAHSKGGKVLVHCAKGKNRSGAICIAYLMTYSHMSLLQATRHVKERRGNVLTNPAFRQQLVLFSAATPHSRADHV